MVCCSLSEQSDGVVECVSAAHTGRMYRSPTGPVYLSSFFRIFFRQVKFVFFPMNSNITDIEYVILENLYASARQIPPLRQRDLAQIAKTSLGMTNSILKRLAQKGWITIKRLNSRNIHYAVTLEGFNEIIHRSYGYFKRTIKNIACYKEAIDEAIRNAAEKKMRAVLLIGASDLEFIVEHSCHHHGVSFLKSADKSIILARMDKQTLMIFAEDIPVSPKLTEKNSYYLSQLLIKVTAAS
jgi:DNA-binding MarR family transcriptional regulator